MGDINVEEDGGEVDGDGDGGDGIDGYGSGGTSSSWQGAGIETYVPQNSSVAAAELRDFFWKIADRFRLFVGRLYIGGEAASEGNQGAHTIGWRAPGVTCAALGCG
jgi:hypothetical protein